MTEDAVEDWRERLETQPENPVRFEVEFGYRDNAARRETAEAAFVRKLDELGGQLIDRAIIDPIRYHAALVEVAPAVIQDLQNIRKLGWWLSMMSWCCVLSPWCQAR